MARRAKLTEEMVQQAIRLKVDGLSNGGIICALGIHESTFYRWIGEPKNRLQRELSEGLKKRRPKTMRGHGIVPSMGFVSSPWDNAPTESLMGTIRSECVHAKTFESREQAMLEIFECIECSHDRLRPRSALGCLSPDEYERRNWPKPLAA